MVRQQDERKCVVCQSIYNLVEIRQIVNMNLDFVKGMTYDRIEAPIIYCNDCYMKTWNKKG
jgi:hypothetical protein